MPSKYSYMKEWRNKNKEHLQKYEKERWKNNKEKRKADFQNWRNDNLKRERKKKREYARKYREDIKLEVIQHYSNDKNQCSQCGYNDIRALEIDHINNDGNLHRKNLVKCGHATYQFLRKNNFPEGFQVLCANCNWIKHIENLKNNLK